MTPTPSSGLIGPPSLHKQPPKTTVTATSTTVSGDPFMDSMTAHFNNTKIRHTPPMGYTENNSATYLSTGNPCLDFFFHVVPDTSSLSISRHLDLAWSHDPLTALKLICNLRGVRGTGKSDKEGFYASAYWLHKNHPKTLAGNVAEIAEFGYFKDFPEILFRLLEGEDVRKIRKKQWKSRGVKIVPSTRRFVGSRVVKQKPKPFLKKNALPSRSVRVSKAEEKDRRSKQKASVSRHEKYAAMAKKLFDRYTRDPDYRFLYERVSDLFADKLKSDIQSLNLNELSKISLAAKWCPSIDSSFDRSTLICESIARKVFPRAMHPEYEGLEEAHYAYRVRDRLRKQILVPIRKTLELPEVYMGANDWGSIPYGRVASIAMKNYKEKFVKHDKDRFAAFLEKVKDGTAKIAAGALLPHEIIASLEDSDGGEVAELQWKRMVDDLLKKGKMKNCLAICDVSGSMSGVPMEVSVALGVLVSELSEEPWKGKLITFSANPQLQIVQGDSLQSKTEFVRQMDWGMNTDFQKVFDLILQVAVNGKLGQEQMIKRVIVFSDMEFDEASRNSWETDYQRITRKFSEKGYGSAVPEVVFWNLRDSKATPVPSNQQGVALVSGFSKNLLKLFLEDSGSLHPEAVMEAAISGDEYKKLAVLD